MINRRRYVIHGENEIAGIRRAAAATAEVRDLLALAVRPGMSTRDVDELARELIAARGGRSAFLGYRGFPGQICISLNDEVVHGIGRPDRMIRLGDVVSLDIGVRLDGYVGDTAKTVIVGPALGAAAQLLEVTQASLQAGIAAARGQASVYDISLAIERVVRAAGYGIVEELVGHGVGRELHEPPEVPNFARPEARRDRLRPGMVLAIEPMVNLGSHRVKTDPDRWTVRTVDGSLSAHFEHMVLITENAAEILTWPKTR